MLPSSRVVCALDPPTGTVRQRATRIGATAEGYAQLCGWLQQWGTPAELLIGLEATGVLWEPLYEAVTQAGYTVLALKPRQTAARQRLHDELVPLFPELVPHLPQHADLAGPPS